jgi:drug/metabolite transporter (DMT)-like permease
MDAKDWALLLLLSFLWGGSFFLIDVIVLELPPLTIVTLRVGIAAIVLWTVLLIKGYEVPKSFKLWRAFLMLGLLNNVIPRFAHCLGPKSHWCGSCRYYQCQHTVVYGAHCRCFFGR